MHEFEADRRQAGPGAVTRDGQHPGKAEIGEDCGLGVVGQEPSKLNFPLGIVGFQDKLFGAGELFVAGYLAHGFAEAAGGESGEDDGIKVLGLGLCAQREADGGIGTDMADPPPQGKEFFGSYENAGLIEKPGGQSRMLQH